MTVPSEVELVNILICGSGSAGLCAAAYLAKCNITCKILESASGPLELGKADGVQCRTVEIFDSFGLAEDLLREAYHVSEVAFWSDSRSGDDEAGALRCTRRVADTPPGITYQPHVILNQARVNHILLDAMKKWNGQTVDYGLQVVNVQVNESLAANVDAYPVTVMAVKNGEEVKFKAKYVLGCDGAHSTVRRSLGYRMIGDSTDSVWGVMDTFPRTSFPDIRKKSVLQTRHGSLLIIPREGDSMVRFYIELPHGTAAKDVKLESLQKAAKQILSPFTLEIADTFWWSAYSIGQRLADHFSAHNRVFLTGDACHTHSPKAGQGMNVSLQDGYNIAWKLAHVLTGRSSPDLLRTYDLERQEVASDLINFDKEFARLFAAKSTENGEDPAAKFSDYFIRAARYTAGLTARYKDSSITWAEKSKPHLATNVTVGMRLPSVQVVRFSDAHTLQLLKALPSDGRWRIVVFTGDILLEENRNRLNRLGNFLASEDGPIRRHTSCSADINSFIDPIIIHSGNRAKLEESHIHELFFPATGRRKMRDTSRIFVDDESWNHGHGHAYQHLGIDQRHGALLVVRPDQYVSLIASVEDHQLLAGFFRRFALPCPQH